jgi:hypothetical protein
MQEMKAREVANVALAMARLHESGRMSVDDELLGELQARAAATAGDSKPADASMLMVALEQLGVKRPDASLVEAMQARARETAGDFKPADASTFMLALEKMDITPDAVLVEAMQARATAPVDEGIAALGGSRSEADKSNSRKLTTEIRDCTDARGLLRLVQQHGRSFNAIHVSDAWGNVTSMPSGGDEDLVMQELQVLTRARMYEMGAREVFNVTLSMARLHESGRMGVDDELVGELQARATAAAGSFKSNDASNFMMALEKMGITPDAALVEAMPARAVQPVDDDPAEPGPANQKLVRLTREISQCRDTGELLELVGQKGASFNAIHVGSAWGALAKLRGAEPRDALAPHSAGTRRPQPSTLNPQPSTLNPQPSTLNPQPSTLNSQPSTLNPRPSTLNPQPSTLNSQPSTLRRARDRGRAAAARVDDGDGGYDGGARGGERRALNGEAACEWADGER